jgi:glutathione S-transferase
MARARARSLCAEMHSGFAALRTHLPFNIEASLPEIGQRSLAEQPDVAADVQRIDELWSRQLAESGGPFLFGRWCIADAFFAPVCTRFRSYDIPLSPPSSSYASRILGLSGMQAWTWEALAAGQFLKAYEPYRDSRPSR